jgi:hypothetical protein
MQNVIYMAILLVPVLWQLRKDFISGLALCLFLLVSMPDTLRLSLGGGIPELTIHRLLLLILLPYWMAYRHQQVGRRVPFVRGLLALAAVQLVSLLLSVHFSGSVKSFSAFALEVVLFFVITSSSLQNREQIIKILYSVGLGVGLVAVVGLIERYWGVNLARMILSDSNGETSDITSTYPHRILFGYAMVIGVPVLFALAECERRRKRKAQLVGMVLLLVAGCYFSQSRGPWSALIVGCGIFFFLGSRVAKRVAVAVTVFGALVLVAKPGVRDTIVSAFNSTFDENNVKGRSYAYRWILWRVAYSEISKSPERMLFGYGGLSTETMDLSEYFESEGGGTTSALGYTSWDNQLACDLVEFGGVGFVIELALFGSVLGKLFGFWRRSEGAEKSIMAAFLSSGVIYLYAMSTVYIFSPQLKCLFWALMACGIRYGQCPEAERAAPGREELLVDSEALQGAPDGEPVFKVV